MSSEGEAISKNSERCILDLAGKVCETSHKYPKLSSVEKAEVEQYLRITTAGGAAAGSVLDLLRRLFIG